MSERPRYQVKTSDGGTRFFAYQHEAVYWMEDNKDMEPRLFVSTRGGLRYLPIKRAEA